MHLSSKSNPPPTVVDLFAGAGGTALGFAKAGYRIVSAIEKDPDAAETYSKNLNVPVHLSDIRNIYTSDYRRQLNVARGSLDVLVGCPPCQGFSSLRNHDGASDTRNQLIFRYLEFVDEFAPRFTMFENVPGLINSNHGRRYYTKLVKGLRTLGYGVAERELNCADFGIAQVRRRIFVLAGRRGYVPPFPWPTHADAKSDLVMHNFRQPWRTVRNAIEHFPADTNNTSNKKHNIWNHTAVENGKRVIEFIKAVPKNGGSRTDVPKELWLKCHLNHSGHKDVYGRMSWDRPSTTITTGCTNPSKGRFVHPEYDRGITHREAATLQGFPEAFVFYGSDIPRQIGNAVPPPVAEALASALLRV